MKTRFLIPVLLLIISCSHKEEKNETAISARTYFDLAKVVQDDIEINMHLGCGEEKSVIVNGNHESKDTNTVDWKKEFQLLADCDLNKPSWKGKFDVQVLNDSLKYVYTTNSAKIPVRKMTINYKQKGGYPVSVEVEKKISSLLFTTEQQIIYFPGNSFKIKASQKAIFMNDFNSEVEIKFICNKKYI